MRWLAFRIMLGAGLIKLRGDPCWTALTCLDAHFETQPIPNLLSPWFHHLPHAVHAAGVVFNHVVEVGLPWFAFGPRRLRLVAGLGMLAFQGVLILSGNLAFLNWLTVVPVLALLDDDFLARCVPRRWRDRLRAISAAPRPPRRGHRIFVACIAALVAIKSVPVVENLASHHQAMNRNYDRLALVNTYGAFGSVEMERFELVIEGTRDPDPATARWSAYELPCKPGALDRRARPVPPPARLADLVRRDVRAAARSVGDPPGVEAARRRSWDPHAARRRSVRRGRAALRPDPPVPLSPGAVQQLDLVDSRRRAAMAAAGRARHARAARDPGALRHAVADAPLIAAHAAGEASRARRSAISSWLDGTRARGPVGTTPCAVNARR
jgi:hypothetical protein